MFRGDLGITSWKCDSLLACCLKSLNGDLSTFDYIHNTINTKEDIISPHTESFFWSSASVLICLAR